MGAGNGSGDGSNLILGATSVGQGIGGIGTAIAQSSAIEASGNFSKAQFEFNSKLADLQAGDAIQRGFKAASAYLKSARRLRGAQRASLAGQGVDLGEGSALEIQKDTQHLSEIDAMTIRNNAWQEAWGFKMQALDLTGRANFTGISSRFDSTNTLLAGGMNALRNFGEGGYHASKYYSKPSKGDDYKFGSR
jgi:hypothetical protein